MDLTFKCPQIINRVEVKALGRPFLTHLTFPQKVFGLGKRWAAASFKVKLEGHDFGAGLVSWSAPHSPWKCKTGFSVGDDVYCLV